MTPADTYSNEPHSPSGGGEPGPDGSAPASAPASVIGAEIVVTGNIEAEVDLQIEGRVIGDVRCATLLLGETSSIVGRIFAQRVRLAGSVEGSIETHDLAIEATARLAGDAIYSRLRIANGGIVEGRLTHASHRETEAAPPTRPRGSRASAAAPSK